MQCLSFLLSTVFKDEKSTRARCDLLADYFEKMENKSSAYTISSGFNTQHFIPYHNVIQDGR